MSREYDVIVVGGGHNGLVCACYLGQAGLNVVVLERRYLVGGAAVSEELWPGFRTNPFANNCNFFQSKVYDDLQLKKFGLDFHIADPQVFKPFPDGRCLFFWKDEERTLREIAKFSERDVRAYLDLDRDLTRLAQISGISVLKPPPSLREITARFTNPADEALFAKVITSSYTDFLGERFESPEIRATISHLGLGSMLPGGPSTPGTMLSMFTYYLHKPGVVHGSNHGSSFFKGGTGTVTEALAKAAQGYGVTLRTNAEVAQVLVKDNRTRGVVLADGEEVLGKAVVTNTDPSRTFTKLIDSEHLDPSFLQQVNNYRYGVGFFSIVLALDGLPNFTASPGDESPGPAHTGVIDIAPSLEYMERAWDDAKVGRTPEKPFMNGMMYSAVYPEMAPPGKHVMTMWGRTVPYWLEKGTWEEEREVFGQRCIDVLTEYAPNLRDLILHYKFYSPDDLENIIGLTHGHIHHGDMTFDQMFSNRPLPGWSNYRTPIKDLYMCGAGNHPSGGVSGAPGHNAAHEILKDWRAELIG